MGGKEVEFRYEKRFHIDSRHRKVTWTVPLYRPRRAILRVYFTKVTDRYSRIYEVRVNGRLAARGIISPRGRYLIANLSHAVTHGNNAIELYISCMFGSWEGKMILETVEILPENPVEQFVALLGKWFAGAKLSPAEQIAIATSTLFPVGAILAAAEIGYSAYQAYKQAKKKGLIK